MTKKQFDSLLLRCSDDESIVYFVQKYIIHGVPFVFDGREDELFDFKNRISKHFKINYYQVYVVGSGKLGFSYLKGTDFSYDSDIDIAIVSEELYDRYLRYVREFQYNLEQSKSWMVEQDYKRYIKFLKYMAKGWMRPDLLPSTMGKVNIKTEWFDFFKDLSYGKSEVGNYKVSAGVYKNYNFLEYYATNSLKEYIKILEIDKEDNNE